MTDLYEYECALSGLTTEGGAMFNADDLADLPVGWTEVSFSRRAFNPKWVAIQQVKKAMVSGLMTQMGDEVNASQRMAVSLQVDAQFFSLEKATPMYFTEVETVYLAPPETDPQVAEAYDELRETLGLELASADEEEEDDDADDSASVDEDE